MSLDDHIEAVNSTVKALDTIASLSQSIIENRFRYSDADLSHALSYEKEFGKAVWTKQVTPDLREDFTYLCMILVQKVKSPANDVFNVMKFSSVAGAVMGAYYRSGMVFFTAIAAGLLSLGLQWYHNLEAKRKMYRAASAVSSGEDNIWDYALSQLHQKRNKSGGIYG